MIFEKPLENYCHEVCLVFFYAQPLSSYCIISLGEAAQTILFLKYRASEAKQDQNLGQTGLWYTPHALVMMVLYRYAGMPEKKIGMDSPPFCKY